MMETRDDALIFSFPEVHREAKCTIIFQRTLRVPDDSNGYPVPPGLGRFPVSPVDEYRPQVPESWKEGGVFFPMYQSEALWVIFVGWYPFAIKVAAGDVNAITGRKILDDRLWRPKDYIVVPKRPWMEWFCVGNGRARQFVALPLGKGLEGVNRPVDQDHDGEISVTVHPMKADCYRGYRQRRAALMNEGSHLFGKEDDGFSAGTMVGQERWGDDFGYGAWELSARSRCTVYPLNSLSYMKIAGRKPPGTPPTPALYRESGLPWYDYYGADTKAMGTGKSGGRGVCAPGRGN